MLHIKRTLNKGFTLAEVLITLGIIGIVAAMTLPALTANYRKQVVVTRMQKFYTVFNQAIKMSELANGELGTWDMMGSADYNTPEGSVKFFNKYLKSYIKTLKTEYYYDTHNEKVLMLFDGMVDGEDNPELFEDIKEGFVEDYIPLPGQYDINEYRIMEEFIYELPAGKNQDVLARTIQGRGAFRRFKDKLYDLNLEKQWYQYREEAYEKIARQWSERHKIDIVE